LGSSEAVCCSLPLFPLQSRLDSDTEKAGHAQEEETQEEQAGKIRLKTRGKKKNAFSFLLPNAPSSGPSTIFFFINLEPLKK